jgi:molecular chaperone GrpE
MTMRKKVKQPNQPTATPEAESPENAENATAPETAAEAAAALEEDLAVLREKAEQMEAYKDHLLRARADLDNFRKRAAREREEAARFANESLMEKLIPVLDSFEMAVQATDDQAAGSDAVRDGVRMIFQQLKSALTDAGLEEIDATGQEFDPNLHEAVSTMETDEVEEGHVAQQLRKGYRLRERLLRPAMVVVARKPAA